MLQDLDSFPFLSLPVKLLLDSLSFLFETAEAGFTSSPLSFFLFMKLSPETLLFGSEILFIPSTHVLQETLFTKNLLFFKLPHPSLFLDADELHLLFELLLPEPLLDLRPLRHLLHHLRLLLHRLPDQLALQTLLLVLDSPPLLEHPVPVLLLTLADIELSLHFPDGLFGLLLLQELEEALIRFKLHVRDVLVLQSRLVLVLSLTLPLHELLLGHAHLLLAKLFLPGECLLEGVLDLADVLELGQPRDLLQPDPLLQHRLLVLLKLTLPLQLGRGSSFLLPPDSLLVGEYLLGFYS